MSKKGSKIFCESSGKAISNKEETYHIFYYLEPDLEYTCCKTCMLNGTIPYYGLIGLLTLINQSQLDLPFQEVQRLKDMAEKKNEQYSEDIKKAVKVYISEFAPVENKVEENTETSKEETEDKTEEKIENNVNIENNINNEQINNNTDNIEEIKTE